MTKYKVDALDSTIQDRMASIRMTPVEREAAASAMRTAFALVDAFVWVVQKVRHLAGAFGDKQAVAH